MRIWLAIRIFFKILFDASWTQRLQTQLLEAPTATPEPARIEPKKAPAPPAPVAVRSEAVTLLATLQREARFVDLVQESLDQYSDAQVGAAARDVLRDCRQVLDRVFALTPLTDQAEGSLLESPSQPDAGRYRFVGQVQGEPPYQGKVTHHGWEATRCEIPKWSGSDAAARVVAPLEIEVT